MTQEEFDEPLWYAIHLAKALWEKHWKEDMPNWKPPPDLLGALRQIDYMTVRLVRALEQSRREE
jgi:hypothetical protein